MLKETSPKNSENQIVEGNSKDILRSELPKDLSSKIVTIGDALQSTEQIDQYEKLENIRNKSQKLQIILNTWETQQKEERNLRKTYAKWLLIALFIQIIFINIAFFLIGFGFMIIERWVATTFIVAVFLEISALLLVVVNYLFPKVGSELIKLLEKV